MESFGVTDKILVVKNANHAYPLIRGFPILLAPERLVPREDLDDHTTADLADPKYAEAYEEMQYYNNVHVDADKEIMQNFYIRRLMECEDISSVADTFPEPADIWLNVSHETLCQQMAYRYLAPVQNKIFLQLGGSGGVAVTMLLAGAKRAYLVTPMIGEAVFAMRLGNFFLRRRGSTCSDSRSWRGNPNPGRSDRLDLLRWLFPPYAVQISGWRTI